MYHALYRKYRPLNFKDVVGQDVIVKTLCNSIKNSSFSHAYMFFGPRGTGKTTVSKIFARAVNCLNPVDGNSCGKCKNCLHSYEKECVDIIEIDAASNNGVDEIRELKNKISLVPAELKFKVYVIDEVHMLSIGAFNALLKTLEEPPKHAIFILATTDPQKVPETIISRCQCFSFRRLSQDVIIDRLATVSDNENINIDRDVLKEIALSSDGGMRDALGMLDKLSSYSTGKITVDDFAELNGMLTSSNLIRFCDYIFNSDLTNVLLAVNTYNSEGKNIIQVLSQVMYYLMDIAVDFYTNNSKITYPLDEVLDLVNLINEKMFDIKKSGNPKIYIETLLIKFINDNNNKNNISWEISGDKKNVDTDIIDRDNNVNDANLLDDGKIDKSKNMQKSGNIIPTDNNFELVEHSIVESESNLLSEMSKISNIDEIMKVRVNNTLALANKSYLKEAVNNMNMLNDYTFDQEVGYIVCALLDSKIRAVSEKSMIISYEYDSVVKQNLLNLNKMIDVYNKITGSNKLIAIITDEVWEIEKGKYIDALKNNIHYTVMEEPEEVLEENKKDDIITSSAIELFGDIVEVE